MLNDGEFAALTVSEVGKIGAFLDWGEPKELFLPFAEMTCELSAGMTILVRKYTDKSGRAAASMKGIYNLLSQNPPYVPGDTVTGRIYEFGRDFGTFVAVDDKYSAMLPKHESVGDLGIGDIVEARVTFVKEDGKLDITTRETGENQRSQDAEKILSLIESYAGVLPFTEKAEPAVILRECGMSKAAFKRALGLLYKQRLIELSGEGKIRLVSD